MVPVVSEEDSVPDLNTQLTEEQCNAMKVAELKNALGLRNLSKNGRKQELLDRLLVSVRSNDTLIENQTPEHAANMTGPTFASTAHYSMLDPDDEVIGEDDLQYTNGHQFCPPIAGLPANEETTQRSTKKNYKEEFHRPPFVKQVKFPKSNLIGRTLRDSDGKFLYEVTNSTDTVPNIDALHTRGISIDSHPAEWFNLFLPIYKKRKENPNVVTIEDFTTWSNKKVYLSNSGTGGSQYPKWTLFSIEEIMCHLGIYTANGLASSPQVTIKFNPQEKDPINSNDFIASAFGPNALRRH